MKKISLAVLAICACMLSCQKEDHQKVPNPGNKEKIPLNFNLANFVQQTESLNNAGARKAGSVALNRDSSLRYKVTDIYYLAYDPSNYLANMKHQRFSQDSVNFGLIKDTLYSDNYTFFFIAANSEINFAGSDLSSAVIKSRIDTNTITPFRDLFLSKINVNVIKGNVPPQEVTLNRIVGNLTVEILDAAVNSAYQISVQVKGENENTLLQNLTPVNDMFSSYHLNMTNVSPTAFSNNIINTTGELTVTITARNAATGDQIQRIIEHVRCYKNKKTTVTGNLNLPGGPDGYTREFQVKVNSDWNPDDNNIGF